MNNDDTQDIDESMAYDEWRDREDAEREANFKRMHSIQLEKIAESDSWKNHKL